MAGDTAPFQWEIIPSFHESVYHYGPTHGEKPTQMGGDVSESSDSVGAGPGPAPQRASTEERDEAAASTIVFSSFHSGFRAGEQPVLRPGAQGSKAAGRRV